MKKYFLLAIGFILFSCANPSNSIDHAIHEFKADYPNNFVTYEAEGRTMRYAWSGDANKRPILFVHGSPGSYEGWSEFLLNKDLQTNFQLIAVDRPGYGGSGSGNSETSLQKQAAAIIGSLNANRSGLPAILVGHSMGGPIIARLAMDFPEKIAGLVFVSASVDPQFEQVPWYQHVAAWPVINWLLPNWLRVCNEEILPLKPELEAMLPLWSHITAKAVVIHGDNDNLVPYGNVAFLKTHLNEKLLLNVETLPGMNHFVPWKMPGSIMAGIQLLNQNLP